jgi:hypothetical protein
VNRKELIAALNQLESEHGATVDRAEVLIEPRGAMLSGERANIVEVAYYDTNVIVLEVSMGDDEVAEEEAE